jgi:quercetin dioxygenase-like cupin family protein
VSGAELERRAAEGFKAMGGEHCRVDTTRNPSMHKTRTVDYVILLDGDVTLILEKEEVRLKPFDVVVQRGTNHAWRNNRDTAAILAGVLIDAAPL